MPPEPSFKDEIVQHRSAAAAPHYRFVQFLIVLCGVLLGLTTGNPGSSAICPEAKWFELVALIAFTVSMVGGSIALYGEKNVHERIWKKMQRILAEHDGDEEKAKRAFASIKERYQSSPWYHRVAFHIQWPLAVAGVILLLAAKILSRLN